MEGFTPFTKPCTHTALLDWPRRGATGDGNFIEAPLPFEGVLEMFRLLGFEGIWV